MAQRTHIEWCDSTFNPWIGCTRVSPACDDCYAARSTPARTLGVAWGAGQPRRRTGDANWKLPKLWNSRRFMQCDDCGWRGEAACQLIGCGACRSLNINDVRRRVFCASLADVFDNEVDPAWRADLFALIEATPNLDWLVLTKRIGNAKDMMLLARGGHLPLLPNVWIGATVVNREEMLRDGPKLLAVPARVRYWSVEPMLDDLGAIPRALLPNWVICGGESGPKARPMHPDWARSLRDQCEAAGVPFLFKQWGEFDLSYDRERDDPDYRKCDRLHKLPGRWINLAGGHGFSGERVHYAHKVGKQAAGRMLDGREWSEFPT